MGWFGGSSNTTEDQPRDFSSSDDSSFASAGAPMSSASSSAPVGMGSSGLQQFAMEQQQRAMIQGVSSRWARHDRGY